MGASTRIFLKMCISDIRCNFVVDFGGCVTIMSTALYNKIPDDVRPKLKPVDKSLRLEVADYGLLQVNGLAEIELQVGKDIFKWDIFVATIREDGLIGLDFLQHFNYNLNKDGLKLNGKTCDTFLQYVPLRAMCVACPGEMSSPPPFYSK